jgi:hypothetical protein
MTEAQLRRRVLRWQKLMEPMGFAHWRLEECSIAEGVRGAENATAGVKPSHYYDHCWMQFDKDWLARATEQELDETIIHEWLHVAWRDLDAHYENLEEALSPASRGFVHDRQNQLTEGLIERLARTIYLMYHR